MRARGTSLILLLLVGVCRARDEAPLHPAYNPKQARGALVAALDAWKKGEATSLSQHNPPIRFVDDDLVSGMRLLEYEIDDPDAPIAQHKDVNVILSLGDARGKTARLKARYQVATEPAFAVLRSDR